MFSMREEMRVYRYLAFFESLDEEHGCSLGS